MITGRSAKDANELVREIVGTALDEIDRVLSRGHKLSSVSPRIAKSEIEELLSKRGMKRARRFYGSLVRQNYYYWNTRRRFNLRHSTEEGGER